MLVSPAFLPGLVFHGEQKENWSAPAFVKLIPTPLGRDCAAPSVLPRCLGVRNPWKQRGQRDGGNAAGSAWGSGSSDPSPGPGGHWWDLGGTLVGHWWDLGGTLVGHSCPLLTSPRKNPLGNTRNRLTPLGLSPGKQIHEKHAPSSLLHPGAAAPKISKGKFWVCGFSKAIQGKGMRGV